ncbi:hypothetical protein F2Q69_00000704 [Brassica cretica]|uniref:RRM domain-containing protein n=1 Tax=Brassica cretica TaxID=69181 RepID=A0A8S9PBM9_BRACR|nr:hypothetical protein F2Q69_00000704 [Brassica cretica]
MLGTASPWFGQSLFVFDFVFFVVGLPSIVYARFAFIASVVALPFTMFATRDLDNVFVRICYVGLEGYFWCAELVSWSFGPLYPELCGFSVACRLIRSVKVGNLSSGATEHDIKEFFSFSGEVESIDIQVNEHSAYVTFKDPQGAETAVLLSIRSVKVGNLSSGATEHDIKEFFSFSGEVESIDIQGNEHSAYVTFKDPQGAETAVLLSVTSGDYILWNTLGKAPSAAAVPVHRLIEQHSIDYWLWADLISHESERRLKSVVRVHQQQDADFFYVPFFTTISFFLLEKQQCKSLYREALKWVTDQPAWKRSEGRDHIFPIHHPWSFKTVRKSVKNAIWLLPDLDSTGNWYKPGQVSLEKDLVLPYVPNVDRCDAKCLSESPPMRTTLLFFRGRLKRNAGGKIRAKLGAELSGVKDVIITEGTAGEGGKLAAQDGMRRSLFCLCPAGDTPSSARLFDAIVSGCIPVIVSDELELPFEGILDYNKVAVIVSSSDAIQPGWLVNHLRSLIPSQVKEFQNSLAHVSPNILSHLHNLWFSK